MIPPVLNPCTPDDPCDEHAAFGGAPAESPESDYARGRREAIEEAARWLREVTWFAAAAGVEHHEAEIRARRP